MEGYIASKGWVMDNIDTFFFDKSLTYEDRSNATLAVIRGNYPTSDYNAQVNKYNETASSVLYKIGITNSSECIPQKAFDNLYGYYVKNSPLYYSRGVENITNYCMFIPIYTVSNFFGSGALQKVAYGDIRTVLPPLGINDTGFKMEEAFAPSASNVTSFNSNVQGLFVVPEGVLLIYSRALCSFYKINYFILPTSLKYIGSQVFPFSTRTIKLLGSTPCSLYPYALSDCSKLETIYVPSASLSAYRTATNWSEYASLMVGF